jgi:hypothetical protein
LSADHPERISAFRALTKQRARYGDGDKNGYWNQPIEGWSSGWAVLCSPRQCPRASWNSRVPVRKLPRQSRPCFPQPVSPQEAHRRCDPTRMYQKQAPQSFDDQLQIPLDHYTLRWLTHPEVTVVDLVRSLPGHPSQPCIVGRQIKVTAVPRKVAVWKVQI